MSQSISAAGQILSVAVILAGFLFWMWMYRDMSGNDGLTAREKENWTTTFIFLNVFGAILYYANVYRKRRG